MKLLVDMNLSPSGVGVLAGAGITAAHWSALGVKNPPDSEIMAYASANGYVVLTHDRDFSAILAATHGEKPSVVQIRAENVSPEAIGQQVISTNRCHCWWRARNECRSNPFLTGRECAANRALIRSNASPGDCVVGHPRPRVQQPGRRGRRKDFGALQSVICRITLEHDPKLQEQEA